MIQIYKLKNTKIDVLENINRVNPWWNKKITRKIIRSKQFISKFGMNPNDYIKFDSIEKIELVDLIKATNNYLNFFVPKLKHIVSNRITFKKFDNFIINYMSLNGNIAAIQAIALFYEHIKSDEANLLNKQSAIDFANKIISEKWKRYENEIILTFSSTENIRLNLNKIFKESIDFKYQLFDTAKLIGWVVKYCSRLFKINSITEAQFLNVLYASYLQLNYNEGFLEIFSHFISNLK